MASIGNKNVPDEGPLGARILLVGEAPGADEERESRPFIGHSGHLLRVCLERAGASESDVRLSNLCHYRPSQNKFETILDAPELRAGIEGLRDYILSNPPRVIGALGGWPLFFLTGYRGISNYRGSILPCKWNPNIKVVASRHPAAITRSYDQYPIFDLDIKRVIAEADIDGFNYPQYTISKDPNHGELTAITERLCSEARLAVDIETVKGTGRILCVGFAPSAREAFVMVPDSTLKRQCIAQILASQAEKCFHNGNFDTTVLASNGFETLNYTWDTMVGAHVLQPEFPRSLAFLTSIYTRQIYYKGEGRSNLPTDDSKAEGDSKSWSEKFDRNKVYVYNGTDCCVTFMVWTDQEKEIREDQHFSPSFDFEMSLLPAARRIGMTGLYRDQERRMLLQVALERKWGKLQYILNQLTGFETNVNSPKLRTILYDKVGLPVRRHRDGKVTTDEDAIIDLITLCGGKIDEYKTDEKKMEWKVKQEICKTVLKIRGIRKNLGTYILNKNSEDGVARSLYGVPGTETGRWNCHKYFDDTGVQAQTLPRETLEIEDSLANDPQVLDIRTQMEEIDDGDDAAGGGTEEEAA